MRYCQACHRCFGDGVEFCLFEQTPTREIASLPLVIEGKYRLEQLIAHGGMGSVYRATHLTLERPVAIKILRPELLSDATARERFNREARAAARLKHPNIVAVYDSGHLPNGSAYLVMELIEGRSLREEMRTHAARLGQMRPERAAGILAQVCAGIEAAHRHGIIHRDLKPDNVMIETPSGLNVEGTERVLVLDFGIAKLAIPDDREQSWQGLTDENMIVGTPKYISPEQCTGNPVDARSDIYSLGVILYEMLTGHVPFAGQNTSAVLLKHLQEPPAPPRRFCPDINPQLEQVVLQALAKNPQQRFSSAVQFAEQLIAAVSLRELARENELYDDTMTAPRPQLQQRQSLAKQLVSDDQTTTTVRPQSLPVESKPPILLPEALNSRRSRARLYASAAIVTLAVIGVMAYFLYADWQATADETTPEVSASSGANSSIMPTPAARSSREGVQENGQKVGQKTGQLSEQVATPMQAEPAAYVKPSPSTAAPFLSEDKIRREVRAVYTYWATAAVRGDWREHANFYADRVEYFRDGPLPREKVVLRKRGIFGKLDSYSLRFSETPQVTLKTVGGKQEAEVIFDRSWTLRRGRKKTVGHAPGIITLRREPKGWRIVSEKQIKK